MNNSPQSRDRAQDQTVTLWRELMVKCSPLLDCRKSRVSCTKLPHPPYKPAWDPKNWRRRRNETSVTERQREREMVFTRGVCVWAAQISQAEWFLKSLVWKTFPWPIPVWELNPPNWAAGSLHLYLKQLDTHPLFCLCDFHLSVARAAVDFCSSVTWLLWAQSQRQMKHFLYWV